MVEQLTVNQRVRGSSPRQGAKIYQGVAQFGRALGLGPRCRGFESYHLDQNLGSVQQTKTLNHLNSLSGQKRSCINIRQWGISLIGKTLALHA